MKKISFIIAVVIATTLLAACGTSEKKGWSIDGTIQGLTNGTVELLGDYNIDKRDYSVNKEYTLTDGKFAISGEPVQEPTKLLLRAKSDDKKNPIFVLYVENGKTTFVGEYKEHKYGADIQTVTLEGSIVNQHLRDYARTSNEKRLEFVKNNPSAYYAGEIVIGMAGSGMSNDEAKKLLAMLSSDINNSNVVAFKKKIAESKDANIADIIPASNVLYKVDSNFDGTQYTKAKYLGVLSSGDIVALNNNKTIDIINSSGKKNNSITLANNFEPKTIAVDEKNNIYVIGGELKEVEQVYRGKTTKRLQIEGYVCDIYDIKGNKQNSFKIEGVKGATGARVADNKLIVADMSARNITIFNAATGAKETEIKGMRPCCGILDFSINNKNEILVANLGAFRVQSYNLSGEQILAFGSRGTGLSEFHGCCNPVSVAYLSNGAIVTVEKDPTRVKVYSKEGAIAIKGIDEMVKGCSYIPMSVDSKDNLYLASPSKGIVRCVAI